MTFKATMAAWEYARLQGSVAPKSVRWAAPCAIFAVIVHKTLHDWTDWGSNLEPPLSSDSTMWTLFSSILGFLVVFRAQLSYARYWEGITLIERACAVWMNGVSNLFAFCSADPAKAEAVEDFQYLASRLMSLLVCNAMHEVSRRDISQFPHLDLEGIDQESLDYLNTVSGKAIVVLQWLQRLVVDKKRSGVIDIEPPILSRAFQEFSIGIVHFIDARKLTDVPFPFQFAQMVVIMLAFFSTLVVPLICAIGVRNAPKAGIYTFLIVFVYWSVHYIAVEIEHPFGEDANDLPLEVLNRRFNKVLLRLLETKAQTVPPLSRNHPRSTGIPGRKSVLREWSPSAVPVSSASSFSAQTVRMALCGGGEPRRSIKQPGAFLAQRLFDTASEQPPDHDGSEHDAMARSRDMTSSASGSEEEVPAAPPETLPATAAEARDSLRHTADRASRPPEAPDPDLGGAARGGRPDHGLPRAASSGRGGEALADSSGAAAAPPPQRGLRAALADPSECGVWTCLKPLQPRSASWRQRALTAEPRRRSPSAGAPRAPSTTHAP